MVKNPIIGIIGGTGLMGQIFKDLFEKQGLTVLIASRRTELKIEECAKKSDVVIISVPIDKTNEIIQKIGPLVKKDGLLMDLTSLKEEPVNAMLKYAGCSVLGTHPVFGPGVNDIKNQTIVLCPGRGEEWLNWIKNIYLQNGAKLKICTANEHDRMMAIIQGMIHFTTITTGHVLKELNIDVKESLEFSSPIYKLRLDMVGRIFSQDPNLYANIELSNPKVPVVLNAYFNSCKKLLKIIKKKKYNEFINYFKEASDYLGDFKDEALDYSNYIINMLVKKNK